MNEPKICTVPPAPWRGLTSVLHIIPPRSCGQNYVCNKYSSFNSASNYKSALDFRTSTSQYLLTKFDRSNPWAEMVCVTRGVKSVQQQVTIIVLFYWKPQGKSCRYLSSGQLFEHFSFLESLRSPSRTWRCNVTCSVYFSFCSANLS